MTGWGLYPEERCRVYRPSTRQQLHQVLEQDSHNGDRSQTDSFPYPRACISRGLGRSYGDAALNLNNNVILHEQMNRLLSFDAETHVLACEAGASLDTIIHTFLPRGYFLPITPGTKYVTVGGAMAADIHGKNQHQDGSFASCVVEFDLLAASGEVVTCSRTQNTNMFWATLGGMGLTGVILEAKIRLMPVESAYLTVDYRRIDHLDNLLAQMSERDSQCRYSVAWIDCLAGGKSLGRSVLMLGDHTSYTDLPAKLRGKPLIGPKKRKATVPFFLPSFVLNPLSVKAFNAFHYARHSNRTAVVDYDSFFYPLDSVLQWNRLYGRRGFLQYQVVLPPQSSQRGLTQMLEKLAASKRASFLAVLKSFGSGNDAMLSFPMQGHTLALDLANSGPDLFKLLDELDRLVVEHGGRVYLAKDARMSQHTFERTYPNVERFRRFKKEIDPNDRFSSSLARRLGLVGSCRNNSEGK